MTTRYPPGLPAVPQDRWNVDKLADFGIERPDDGWAVAVADFALDAGAADQAELRLLAYIDHSSSPGADLRGMTAAVAGELAPGRWRVTLRVPGDY